MGELRTAAVTAVHFAVPEGIDDPAAPSGGNVYDRRVSQGLAALGWRVHEHGVPGRWPHPDVNAFAALAGVVAGIPDGRVVLLDGLVASTAPEVLVAEATRLRLVVLVHMPLGHAPSNGRVDLIRQREAAVLRAASAVVATSAWTRRRLAELYSLPAGHSHLARPGVDAAELAPGTPDGERLLCVAAVTPEKGHDVLIDALATLEAQSWSCRCVGSLDRDPDFVRRLRGRAGNGRMSFHGPQTGADLDRLYAEADLLVLPSRAETYGMVVTEALARGVPVIATDVGGVTEALGYGADGVRPGLLVTPDDAVALADALGAWLRDSELRARLRRAARERRETLDGWAATASALAAALPRAT